MVLTLLKLDGGNYKFVGSGVRVWVSKASFPGGVAPATLDVSALGIVAPAPKVQAPAPVVDIPAFDAGLELPVVEQASL